MFNADKFKNLFDFHPSSLLFFELGRRTYLKLEFFRFLVYSMNEVTRERIIETFSAHEVLDEQHTITVQITHMSSLL